MRHQRARFLVALLIAALGLIVLASPAGASGESVGECMTEKIELAYHDGHLDEDLLDTESFQKKLEKCFDAPKMIFPELNEIIWGGAAFLILLVVMVKKGFPAVKGAMDARAERIRADLDAAETAKSDAQAVQADY